MYGGEIWRADVCRLWVGLRLGLISIGAIVVKKSHFIRLFEHKQACRKQVQTLDGQPAAQRMVLGR